MLLECSSLLNADLVYLFSASFPVAVGLAGAGLWWLLTRRFRVGLIVLVSMVAFGLLDLAMFRAVRYLGFSFGSVRVPFLFMISSRAAISFGGASVLLGWMLARWLFTPLTPAGPLSSALWVVPLGLNLVLSGGLADAVFLEPRAVQLDTVELSANLPALEKPLRIVHLSDMHIEFLTRREEDAIRMINDLNPDLIVITGDYINTSYLEDPESRRHARDFMARLRAQHGIYAIWGNCDDRWWRDELFGGLNITLLEDCIERVSVGGQEVRFLGLDMHRDFEDDRAAFATLVRELPDEGLNVLLYHTPDLMPEAAASNRIDLYLAGHTHGGQVRLPLYGAVFTASIYGKRYEAGLYRDGRTTMYVSRGLGLEGGYAPRVRFMCPPEITLVTINANGGLSR